MENTVSRRNLLKGAIVGAVAVGAMSTNGMAMAGLDMGGRPGNLLPPGASTLQELSDRLAKAPRRRNFKNVPMILTSPDQWDSEALNEIIHYAGGPKQVWDNTDLTSPWLNLMRNSMNAQIWSFKHQNFLAVSATHGSAHLALYDNYIWNKYLAKFTKGKWHENIWIKEPKASGDNPANYNDAQGVFSPHDNSIAVLQRRGAIFLACHNEVWELTMALHEKGINPDALSHEELAAEFTNHLISGAVLTPGIVGTLPELELAGFQYAK